MSGEARGDGGEDLVPIDSDAVWAADAADVEEAIVANWFAREGASVEAGDTVCEMQIEKVSIDVPAPATGVLEAVEIRDNEEFRRGDALGYVRPG
jgi:pyruvate/2-oxoglutarate dehydrogenase complex dihydrolipoamide acyltransferase (E2) component